MEHKENFSTNEKLAEKTYDPSDYVAKDELSRGLAVTHEQVSDAYMEGTVDGVIENYQGTGKNVKISKIRAQQE